ncbi:MAG: hypothetical protein WC375_11085 [Methanomassiliicoccales archaeon]|jgi:hypothetical protein
MGMEFFWICTFVIMFFGIWLTISSSKITWIEWAITFVVSFAVTGIFHLCAVSGMQADNEIWSGQIVKAVYYPEWVERYTEHHSGRVGSGASAHTIYWTDSHLRTHHEKWEAETSLFIAYGISESFYKEICKNFASLVTEQPQKGGFVSGDKNVYASYNKTKYIYPTTDVKSWANKVRAAPSKFSFPKIDRTKVPVFEYPLTTDWLRSKRLLGTAGNTVTLLEFDRMNALLNPYKEVNVILIGFGDKESELGSLQEAYWLRGKKNDLVLCYGGKDPLKPSWAYVFGWTEVKVVKDNLRQILLKNEIDDTILPLIEAEIRQNYKIKDWSQLDYIKVEPPRWVYYVYFTLIGLTQLIAWLICYFNGVDDC